jgi:tetratricopeptide (TPR) repeat protein
MWFAAVARAAPVVVPLGGVEVVFETSARQEVDEAVASLRAGRYDEAARRLGDLADASDGVALRYLEGLACLEGAWLRCAEEASRVGLSRAPDHLGLIWLRGRVLSDLGRGDEAIALLDRAAAGDDGVLRAAALLDRAVLRIDRGDVAAAEADLDAAAREAMAAGAVALPPRIAAARALAASLRGGGASADRVGAVGDALARGDLSAARAALPAAPPNDPREAIAAAIATALVRRAEGRAAEAASLLGGAAADARERGLVRETTMAEGQLGVLHAASGAWPAARDRLVAALRLVEGSSFRVLELSLRAVAARVWVRLGDLEGAGVHAARASSIAAAVTDASGKASAQEARALVAAARGDVAAAAAAYDAAGNGFAALQQWSDAARVALGRVELAAAASSPELTRAAGEARALFVRAGDPLGNAHVALAEGLGRGRAQDLDGALTAFGKAAELARARGGPAAAQLERVAKDNAAVAMVGLTGSGDAAAIAARYGMDDLVERHARFVTARADYDRGMAAYEGSRWAEARTAFDAAVTALDALGETGMAHRARRGRAWSDYNASTSLGPTEGLPVWQRLVEEALFLQDPELRVRAMAAGAVARGTLGGAEAARVLRAASLEAERLGLRDVAGLCEAGLADVEAALADRARAARRAFALRDGDETGVYALYTVAVAAYDAGDPDLALALAQEALPNAGRLEEAIEQVIAAATPR